MLPLFKSDISKNFIRKKVINEFKGNLMDYENIILLNNNSNSGRKPSWKSVFHLYKKILYHEMYDLSIYGNKLSIEIMDDYYNATHKLIDVMSIFKQILLNTTLSRFSGFVNWGDIVKHVSTVAYDSMCNMVIIGFQYMDIISKHFSYNIAKTYYPEFLELISKHNIYGLKFIDFIQSSMVISKPKFHKLSIKFLNQILMISLTTVSCYSHHDNFYLSLCTDPTILPFAIMANNLHVLESSYIFCLTYSDYITSRDQFYDTLLHSISSIIFSYINYLPKMQTIFSEFCAFIHHLIQESDLLSQSNSRLITCLELFVLPSKIYENLLELNDISIYLKPDQLSIHDKLYENTIDFILKTHNLSLISFKDSQIKDLQKLLYPLTTTVTNYHKIVSRLDHKIAPSLPHFLISLGNITQPNSLGVCVYSLIIIHGVSDNINNWRSHQNLIHNLYDNLSKMLLQQLSFMMDPINYSSFFEQTTILIIEAMSHLFLLVNSTNINYNNSNIFDLTNISKLCGNPNFHKMKVCILNSVFGLFYLVARYILNNSLSTHIVAINTLWDILLKPKASFYSCKNYFILFSCLVNNSLSFSPIWRHVESKKLNINSEIMTSFDCNHLVHKNINIRKKYWILVRVLETWAKLLNAQNQSRIAHSLSHNHFAEELLYDSGSYHRIETPSPKETPENNGIRIWPKQIYSDVTIIDIIDNLIDVFINTNEEITTPKYYTPIDNSLTIVIFAEMPKWLSAQEPVNVTYDYVWCCLKLIYLQSKIMFSIQDLDKMTQIIELISQNNAYQMALVNAINKYIELLFIKITETALSEIPDHAFIATQDLFKLILAPYNLFKIHNSRIIDSEDNKTWICLLLQGFSQIMPFALYQTLSESYFSPNQNCIFNFHNRFNVKTTQTFQGGSNGFDEQQIIKNNMTYIDNICVFVYEILLYIECIVKLQGLYNMENTLDICFNILSKQSVININFERCLENSEQLFHFLPFIKFTLSQWITFEKWSLCSNCGILSELNDMRMQFFDLYRKCMKTHVHNNDVMISLLDILLIVFQYLQTCQKHTADYVFVDLCYNLLLALIKLWNQDFDSLMSLSQTENNDTVCNNKLTQQQAGIFSLHDSSFKWTHSQKSSTNNHYDTDSSAVDCFESGQKSIKPLAQIFNVPVKSLIIQCYIEYIKTCDYISSWPHYREQKNISLFDQELETTYFSNLTPFERVWKLVFTELHKENVNLMVSFIPYMYQHVINYTSTFVSYTIHTIVMNVERESLQSTDENREYYEGRRLGFIETLYAVIREIGVQDYEAQILAINYLIHVTCVLRLDINISKSACLDTIIKKSLRSENEYVRQIYLQEFFILPSVNYWVYSLNNSITDFPYQIFDYKDMDDFIKANSFHFILESVDRDIHSNGLLSEYGHLAIITKNIINSVLPPKNKDSKIVIDDLKYNNTLNEWEIMTILQSTLHYLTVLICFDLKHFFQNAHEIVKTGFVSLEKLSNRFKSDTIYFAKVFIENVMVRHTKSVFNLIIKYKSVMSQLCDDTFKLYFMHRKYSILFLLVMVSFSQRNLLENQNQSVISMFIVEYFTTCIQLVTIIMNAQKSADINDNHQMYGIILHDISTMCFNCLTMKNVSKSTIKASRKFIYFFRHNIKWIKSFLDNQKSINLSTNADYNKFISKKYNDIQDKTIDNFQFFIGTIEIMDEVENESMAKSEVMCQDLTVLANNAFLLTVLHEELQATYSSSSSNNTTESSGLLSQFFRNLNLVKHYLKNNYHNWNQETKNVTFQILYWIQRVQKSCLSTSNDISYLICDITASNMDDIISSLYSLSVDPLAVWSFLSTEITDDELLFNSMLGTTDKSLYKILSLGNNVVSNNPQLWKDKLVTLVQTVVSDSNQVNDTFNNNNNDIYYNLMNQILNIFFGEATLHSSKYSNEKGKNNVLEKLYMIKFFAQLYNVLNSNKLIAKQTLNALSKLLNWCNSDNYRMNHIYKSNNDEITLANQFNMFWVQFNVVFCDWVQENICSSKSILPSNSVYAAWNKDFQIIVWKILDSILMLTKNDDVSSNPYNYIYGCELFFHLYELANQTPIINEHRNMLKNLANTYVEIMDYEPLNAYTTLFPDSTNEKLILYQNDKLTHKCFLALEQNIYQSTNDNKESCNAIKVLDIFKKTGHYRIYQILYGEFMNAQAENDANMELVCLEELSKWDIPDHCVCQADDCVKRYPKSKAFHLGKLLLFHDGFDKEIKDHLKFALSQPQTMFCASDELFKFDTNTLITGSSTKTYMDTYIPTIEAQSDTFVNCLLNSYKLKPNFSNFEYIYYKINQDFNLSVKLREYPSGGFLIQSLKNLLDFSTNLIPDNHIFKCKIMFGLKFSFYNWMLNDKGFAISSIQSVIQELQSAIQKGVNDIRIAWEPKLLAYSLTLCGDWLHQGNHEYPINIFNQYYLKALDFDSKSARIHDSVAKFCKNQCLILANYTKSEVFEQKSMLMNFYEDAKLESKTLGKKHSRYQMTIDKQSLLDRRDIDQTTEQMQQYMHQTMRSLLRTLQLSNAYNDSIFSIISLWFQNETDTQLMETFREEINTIPCNKWLPLSSQLIARLSPEPTPFNSIIREIITSLISSYPRNVIYSVLAIINSHIDEHLSTTTTVTDKYWIFQKYYDAFDENLDKNDLLPYLDAKSVAMYELCLGILKNNSNLQKIFDATQKLAISLIELGDHKLPNFDKKNVMMQDQKAYPITRTLLIYRINGWKALFESINIPFKSHTNNNDTLSNNIVSFNMTYKFAGGVNMPKIMEFTTVDGIVRKMLVKNQDDLRQDAVMQQFFGLINHFIAKQKKSEFSHIDSFCQNLPQKKSSEEAIDPNQSADNTIKNNNMNTKHGNKSINVMELETYTVLPLSQRSGILEWCQNTIPFGVYLVGTPKDETIGAHYRYRYTFNDYSALQCRKMLMTTSDKLSAYQDICRHFKPVMHSFFFENFVNPQEWVMKRSAYTASVAMTSMAGYILGLGDRHVQNILIQKNTGKIIHIDLGVAFEQGKLLPTPETVPFRLTRDVVNGMGIFGIEGKFRKTCEKSLQILRDNYESLLTILEIFLYDPLYIWTLSPHQIMKKQRPTNDDLIENTNNIVNGVGLSSNKRGDKNKRQKIDVSQFNSNQKTQNMEAKVKSSNTPNDTNKLAERVILRVKQKLQGLEDGHYMSVEGHVNHLIREAMDPKNLSKLFAGWQPYI